jgi:SAM-dependent methyltransferase
VRLEAVDCPGCGSGRAALLFEGSDATGTVSGVFRVQRCGDCGLGYLSPRPFAEDLHAVYAEGYGPRRRRGARDRARRKATGKIRRLLQLNAGYPLAGGPAGLLSRLAAKPAWWRLRLSRRFVEYPPWQGAGKLLDVGSGSGQFLALAEALGWKAVGLEMSSEAAASARELGLEVTGRRLDDAAFEPGSFDVVTFWHSLEHMAEPARALEKARELLRPEGYVMVAAPDVDCPLRRLFGAYWLGADLPRHLVFFSVPSLVGMLDRCGFTTERVYGDRRVSGVKESLNRLPEGGRLLKKLWGFRLAQRLEGAILSLARSTDFVVVRARKRPGSSEPTGA